MRELEAWLEIDLIDRSKDQRKPAFTPQGRQLGAAAVQSFSDLHLLTESLRERRTTNTVLIDTTPSFAARWLLPRLPEFEASNPRIQVSVLVDQRQRDPDSIRCDLSIRTGIGPWPETQAEPLMSDHLVPVASPGYWARHPKPENMDDLKGHRLLHDRDPNASWGLWRDMFGPADLDIRSGQRFVSSDLVIRAAEHGLGITLAHSRLIEDSLKNSFLEPAFEGISVDLPTIYWVIPSERKPTSAAKLFLNWLHSKAQERA